MIKIDWQQMPPRKGEAIDEGQNTTEQERLYPRIKDNGSVSFDELCRKASNNSVFTHGELKGAFLDLMSAVVEQLADGKAVEMVELGSLSLTLAVNGDVTASTRRRMDKVPVKGVAFRASDELLTAVRERKPKFTWAADHATQYAAKTGDMIETLKAYLAEHGSITRVAFAELFALKRTTAIGRLNELARMGVVRREGTNRNSVYVQK